MSDFWNMLGDVFDSSKNVTAPEPKPLAGDKDLYDRLIKLQDVVKTMSSTLIEITSGELSKLYSYMSTTETVRDYCNLDKNILVGLSQMVDDYLLALNRTEIQINKRISFRRDLKHLDIVIDKVRSIWLNKFQNEYNEALRRRDELSAEISDLQISLRKAEAKKFLNDSTLDIFEEIRSNGFMDGKSEGDKKDK